MIQRQFHLPTAGLIVFAAVLAVGYDFWVAWGQVHDALISQQKRRAEAVMERVYKTSSNEQQLKILLDRFHAKASRILLNDPGSRSSGPIAKIYRDVLGPYLPKHDLMLWLFDPFRLSSKPVFKKSGGFGFAGKIGTSFIRCNVFPAVGKRVLQTLKHGMTRALSFPLSEGLLGERIGKGMQVFNSFEGRRALYFTTFPQRVRTAWELRVHLAGVLDVQTLEDSFWAKSVTRLNGRSHYGIGLISADGRKGFFSGFFRSNPTVKRAVLGCDPGSLQPGFVPDLLSDHLVLVGQECGENMMRPILVQPLTGIAEARKRYLSLFFAAAFAILAGVVLLALLPRTPIGLILTLVFILITALPIFGVRTISRFIVFEENWRGEQETSRRLNQELKSFDRETLFQQAALARLMRSIRREPNVERALWTEASSSRDLGFAASMTMRLRRIRSWCDRYQGFYLVVGPKEFSRFWNTASHQLQDQDRPDILQLLKPAALKGLEVLQDKHAGKKALPRFVSKTPSKKDIEYEMVKDFIGKGLGNEMGYNLVNSPNRIQAFRMNIGQLFIVLDPVYFNGRPEFLNLWGWDEAIFIDAYKSRFPKHSLNPLEPTFFVKISSQQLFWYPDGLESLPFIGGRLFDLTRRSRDNNLATLRAQADLGTQTVVMQTIPGYLTDSLFVGARFVGDPSKATKEMFRKVVLGAFAVALVLAFFAMGSFMAPLNRILTAIRQIGPGNYDVRLEETERGDEFGTLAQAFNMMMSGLKERDLLGKYVSDSVKQLISAGGVQDQAKKGQQRSVTVLFSTVMGFEEIQAERTPQEIFKLMNNHLSAMATAVKIGGGEISKVMGEKIMVVFDHEAMGGNDKTAEACLRVIRHLKEVVHGMGFEVEVGVNSGPVIAGLLGSPAVRLDYTVIGDTVNLASRLAVLAHTTDGSRVVISGATLELLGARVSAKRLPFKKVKGKTQAVEVFQLDLGDPSAT